VKLLKPIFSSSNIIKFIYFFTLHVAQTPLKLRKILKKYGLESKKSSIFLAYP